MARDKNPNDVKRSEVDEVFMATAGELMYRKHKAKTSKHLHETQRLHNLAKAQKIVDRANQKGKK